MKYAILLAMLSVCLLMCPVSTHAQEQENQEQKKPGEQQLLDRIEELEKQLKRIEAENKARKTLEITEEEKVQKEKEVLDAVSPEYTLDPQRTLSIDYNLSYTYSPSEELLTAQQQLELKRTSEHTITHSISSTYGILDNLSTSLNLPIVYRYNKRGTDEELDQTDIGDISLGLLWQPLKSSAGDINTTLSLGFVLPTGRSPYKINTATELNTGDGVYAVSAGANFSKQVDPVVVFWNVGYRHAFELTNLSYRVLDSVTLEDVETGDSYSFGGGMAYALSYATSINMSFSYSYKKSTKLTYKEISSAINTADTVSASFGIGMGWKVSKKTTLSYSLAYSLADSSFSLSFRVPFNFVL